mmetsp:Transcript_11571/g.30954  ORF Transcript_11571/g.30954 Transcript_11571/m.30954 type:complete len:126 (+) Transcript_11571:103-480(+)
MAALQVELMSMAYQGQVLSLEEGSKEFADLELKLAELPFGKGTLKLGKTFEEMGSPANIVKFSCGHSTTVRWHGKTLVVSSDDGGPGDGADVTEKWNAFEALAQPLYKQERTPELLLEPMVPTLV